MATLLTIGLIGCLDPMKLDDTALPSDERIVVGEPGNVTLTLAGAGLVIEIAGSTTTGWSFGNIVEDADLWNEACLDSSDVCHALEAEGGTLAWCSSGTEDCTAMAPQYWASGLVSYVLIPDLGTGCFTWGDRSDYWKSLGCSVTSWDPAAH